MSMVMPVCGNPGGGMTLQSKQWLWDTTRSMIRVAWLAIAYQYNGAISRVRQGQDLRQRSRRNGPRTHNVETAA